MCRVVALCVLYCVGLCMIVVSLCMVYSKLDTGLPSVKLRKHVDWLLLSAIK